MGSIARPLPLGPLVSLQFAITYVNLAIPSTAARVAISVRFFQRFGVGPATAMTAGVIDSVAGLIVQVVLLVTLFFFADLDFSLQLDPDQLSGLVTIGLIVIAVMIVAGRLPRRAGRAPTSHGVVAPGRPGAGRGQVADEAAPADPRQPRRSDLLRRRPWCLRAWRSARTSASAS